jgi:hypothetical protein
VEASVEETADLFIRQLHQNGGKFPLFLDRNIPLDETSAVSSSHPSAPPKCRQIELFSNRIAFITGHREHFHSFQFI